MAHETGLLLAEERRQGPEVSLYERYFADPDELAVGDRRHLERRLLECVNANASRQVVGTLVARGADVNCVDDNGDTPLHACAKHGFAPLARFLIQELGADDSRVNRGGLTPAQCASSRKVRQVFFERYLQRLFESAQNDNVQVLGTVIQHLQSQGAFEPEMPAVLLHVAAEHGAARVLQYMLDVHGVPVDATTGVGRSALHYAVEAGNYEIIRLLLERGADAGIADMRGRKPCDVTSDRIAQRILRQAARRGEGVEARFRDYFAWSSTLVEASFVVGVDLDLEIIGTSTPSSKLQARVLQIFAAEGFDEDQVECYLPFCREAVASVLSLARAEDEMHASKRVLDLSEHNHSESFFLVKDQLSAARGDLPPTSEADERGLGGGEGVPLLHLPFEQINEAGAGGREDKNDDGDGGGDDDGAESTGAGRKEGLKELSPRARLAYRKLTDAANKQTAALTKLNKNLFRPVFFPFVVTGNEGIRSFGSLVCFVQGNPADPRRPEARCVCLVSRLPLLSAHRDVLFDAFAVGMGLCGCTNVEDLLRSVVGRKIGLPGDRGVAVDIGTRYITFTNPPTYALPVVDDLAFDALLACLSPRHIAEVVSALLAEQPVLLISDHTQLLTLCSQAMLALLFPFEWHFPYIPLLPREMVDIIEAPFPFLIGIRSAYFPFVSADRLGSVVVVNLDHDSVVSPIAASEAGGGNGKEMPTLPAALARMIEIAAEQALPPPSMRLSPVALVRRAMCPGRRFHFEEAEHQPATGTSGPVGVAGAAGSRAARAPSQAPWGHKYAAFKSAVSSDSPLPIGRLRAACIRVLVALVGSFSKVHFERERRQEVLAKETPENQAFLLAFLATQMWGSFVDEVCEEARSQRREQELQLFTRLMDRELNNETVLVRALNLYVHREPKEWSPIENTLQRGDRVTIIARLESEQKSAWLRLREYRGWCLARPAADFEAYEDPHDLPIERLHFGNAAVHPHLQHAEESAMDHDTMFHDVNAAQRFPI